jgi:thiamine-monophosphate kinase
MTSSLHAPLVMTRDAARIGDVVAITGSVGDSAGGLQLLLDADEDISSDKSLLRERHERPQPRVASGQAAVRAGIRCAMDVSDGLVQDLGHIVRASGTGIRIDAARVPTSEALREVFPGRAMGFALNGGEDYELLLIGQQAAMDRLIATSPVPVTEIGEVVHYDEPRVAVVDESGREIPMARGGWDHFGGA